MFFEIKLIGFLILWVIFVINRFKFDIFFVCISCSLVCCIFCISFFNFWFLVLIFKVVWWEIKKYIIKEVVINNFNIKIILED